jgi:hypothetical protein
VMLPPPYFEQVDQQAEQGERRRPWRRSLDVIALPSPPNIAVPMPTFPDGTRYGWFVSLGHRLQYRGKKGHAPWPR